jgi:DNA polymerase III subunit gamma/tau
MQDSLFDYQDNKASRYYKCLALKYRPATFRELVGQDVLVKTLSNAIKMNRMPQAILLTGIRGVGKTTTARIIAKILNCNNLDLEDSMPNPCGQCESCISITKSQNQDVLEMDAASHTGVNDVRSIIENIHYKPMIGTYKVYIIDEVHMLSNSAFNALLKTLEEPPQHLIFILATTEIQKIPLTILSRCQRFDLKRLPQGSLKNHYLSILHKEKIEIEEAALDMIVKSADGSVRDGLSILDQVIALSNGSIQASLVSDILCFTDKKSIVQIFLHLINGSTKELLDFINSLYNAGSDPIILLSQLLELIHDLSKMQVMGNNDTIYGVEGRIWLNYSH